MVGQSRTQDADDTVLEAIDDTDDGKHGKIIWKSNKTRTNSR